MNRMRRTSVLGVVSVLAVGLIVGRLTPPLIVRAGGSVPTVSLIVALLLAVAAAIVGVLAWNTWQSLHKKRQRMTSQHAITMLSVAKAGASVGALVTGFYGGFALAYLGSTDTELGLERVVHGTAAAVAGLLLLIASLLLERACIVPTDDDEDGAKAKKKAPPRSSPEPA